MGNLLTVSYKLLAHCFSKFKRYMYKKYKGKYLRNIFGSKHDEYRSCLSISLYDMTILSLFCNAYKLLCLDHVEVEFIWISI